MEVMHAHPVLSGLESKLIRMPMGIPALDAANRPSKPKSRSDRLRVAGHPASSGSSYCDRGIEFFEPFQEAVAVIGLTDDVELK